jgi:hypothetical protein
MKERRVPHIQHNMFRVKLFTIVLLTIYRNEAPSAITILALFPENKKSSSEKIGISGQ